MLVWHHGLLNIDTSINTIIYGMLTVVLMMVWVLVSLGGSNSSTIIMYENNPMTMSPLDYYYRFSKNDLVPIWKLSCKTY